jgi:cation transport regulator ChaB
MTAERRDHLRQIMTLAWQKLRWERSVMCRPFSLSQALQHAWAWFKAADQREAEQKAAQAAWSAAKPQVTHLRSIMRSPIRRSLTGQRDAGGKDFRAAYTTARLGC